MVKLNLMVFDLLKFLLFVFFGLFLPGRFLILVSRLKAKPEENFFLSLGLGIALLSFLAFILGYSGLSLLLFPTLLLIDLSLFKKGWRPSFKVSWQESKFTIFIVFLGALFQSILMFKSGTSYQGGLAFWGVHGYDAVWHASLIQELTSHFPPQHPGFAGELLKNYHFLTDLFMAEIHKATSIPILDLYFRFCPILFTIALNSLIYFLIKRWSGKREIALWAVFFVSVAGSFGFLPQLLGKGSNNWETAFWSVQPTTAFLNPPFGVSLILLVTGFFFLESFLKDSNRWLILPMALSFGTLVGFKIYAGIIVLGTLGIIAFWDILRGKKELLLLFLPSLFLSLSFYFPVSSCSINYLVCQPWWFIKTMVEAPDRLNWPSLEMRRQIYVFYSDWLSLFLLQAFAFVIFVVGNLGLRFLGFFSTIKKIKLTPGFDQFLILFSLLAFLPPIFFIQKAVPWNSIQFFYYFVFIFSFFAAETMVWLLTKWKFKFLKIVFSLLVIGLALPSTIKTIYWFNAPVPTTLLEAKEVEALKFLKDNSKPSDILLTYPFGEVQVRYFSEPPVPMTYYNSPYVTFFTERRAYLEDQNSATILSYDVEFRLKEEQNFFSFQNPSASREFLKTKKINYLYLVDNQGDKVNFDEVNAQKIFDNQKVRIYRVNDTI